MTGAVFRPSSPAQKDPPSLLPSPPLLFIVVVLEEKEEERLIVPLFLFPSFSSCLKAHCTVGNRRESTRGYWDWPFSRFAFTISHFSEGRSRGRSKMQKSMSISFLVLGAN